MNDIKRNYYQKNFILSNREAIDKPILKQK